MKFFETYQGGHPFQLDDLRHVQSSFIEFIEQCFTRMGSPAGQPCILTGCEITGTAPTRQVAAGWVYWGNKVYRVPAATITGSHPHIILAPNGVVNSPSPVLYTNAVSRNCHMDYIMVANSTPDPNLITVMYLSSARRWANLAWTTPALPPEFLAGPATGPTAGPAYRKALFGRVELKGAIRGNAASAISTTLFTLPPGHRPARRVRFIVAGTSISMIDIETFGDVNAFPVPLTGQDIYLDGIMFDAE
jgi:hypothetical protein